MLYISKGRGVEGRSRFVTIFEEVGYTYCVEWGFGRGPRKCTI